ncbi:P-loop NTPase fold protein [Photobacterium kishitanii]|uniref:P-loop NTPase fold protein n=1 Tax=Photobacterium kishitanii TaxID=318456 RepID=UPI0011B24CAC|nr:P-loop NTPase fold protein [Photobacterium kishitanii]
MFESKWFISWSTFYLNLSNCIQSIIFFISGLIINKILLYSGDYNENQEYQGFSSRIKYFPIRYAIAIDLFLLFFFIVSIKDLYSIQLVSLCIGLCWGFFGDIFDIKNKSTKILITIKIHINKAYKYLRKKLLTEITDEILPELESDKDNTKTNFLSWLLSENSINNNNEDRFNREFIIERVVSRLHSNNSTLLRGQTIVGDYGSGKSSVLNLVEKKLIEKDGWIICRFDSWGRINSGSQGQKLILEKIIEEIGKHIGVSSIQSIPKDYINALSGFGSWWKNTIEILYKTDLEPNTQLDKIESILKTINKKLLVFIEDIDRNPDSENLAKSISPLLDRFVNAPNIHFIFTIGYEEHISSVITRITSYREDLLINDNLIDNLLSDFRNTCISKSQSIPYFDGLNYLTIWPLRDYSFKLTPEYSHSLKNYYKNAYTSLKYYTRNPRDAKYLLRHVYESWVGTLGGNVNFDDLLLINTLKYKDPIAYDFIISNIDLLNKEQNKESLQKLRLRWEDISSEIFSPTHSINIINYLFNIDIYDDTSAPIITNLLHQRIVNNNEYFHLIINNYIPSESIKDTNIIIDLYNLSNLTPLHIADINYEEILEEYNCLINQSSLERCIQFKDLIPTERIWFVFYFLSKGLEYVSDDNEKNNLYSYYLKDLVGISITKLDINIAKEAFTFTIKSLIVNNIQESISVIDTYKNHYINDDLFIIMNNLSTMFFEIYSNIDILIQKNVTPEQYSSLMDRVYNYNQNEFINFYSILLDEKSVNPELNLSYFNELLYNSYTTNEEFISFFDYKKLSILKNMLRKTNNIPDKEIKNSIAHIPEFIKHTESRLSNSQQ